MSPTDQGGRGLPRFLLGRFLQGLLVVLGVTTIVFVVTRLIGDPVQAMLPVDASAEDRAVLARALGMDGPIWLQYLHYLRDIASFQFGDSLWQHRPAVDIVLERLSGTLTLCLGALTVAVLLGVPLAIAAALKPGQWADRISVLLSLSGLSLPQFWLGLLLILLFAVTLNWLPSSGSDTAASAVLPIMTLALPALGRIAMMLRSALIDELNSQYVRTARAKGLRSRRVVLVHALRNAAVPTVALLGWEFAAMLAGHTVVVETVFAWPGLGQTAVQAIERQDLVLLQAVVFFIAFLIVILNFCLDIVYRVLDRRIAV
ncbi:ABC transporter permease [Achromobacter sp. ACRQX]|uniref:ABC transporter permease n=1 Tax=Achromobacter sp. ACRQX TaxID=2918181 RepID=UPI001EF29686|nr:ABC transporter permease [Achromobacter sp. ACRQX]